MHVCRCFSTLYRSAVLPGAPESQPIGMIRTQLRTETHDMNNFLAGLGLGFGLGLLFAPMSGQELRGSIADRTGDIADTARDQCDQVRETSRAAISSIRGEAESRLGTPDIRTGTK